MAYLTLKQYDWADLLINGHPLRAPSTAPGSIGFSVIFETFEEAVEFVDGDLTKVVPVTVKGSDFEDDPPIDLDEDNL